MSESREMMQERIISWIHEFHDVADNQIGFNWRGSNEFVFTIATDDFDDTLIDAIQTTELIKLSPPRNMNGMWLVVGQVFASLGDLELSDLDPAEMDEADMLE
ncbi:MAG: hypothetical protein ACF8OB_04960 [Phycisphaeraceae bacterium JB051]